MAPFRRLIAGLLMSCVLAGCVLAGFVPLPAEAGSVGFAMVDVPDRTGPDLKVGIWYPTDAATKPAAIGLFEQELAKDGAIKGSSLPLIVISHGTGGDLAGHSDTALALSQAGFVVAALTHTGDNVWDHSKATDLAGRTRQLSAVIDYMVSRWRPAVIDAARVGAFGFSSGGFTVLAAAGGEPRLDRIGPYCLEHPTFFDCSMLASRGGAKTSSETGHSAFAHDARIRALVIAAPALGFTFTVDGLRGLTIPIQLWRAENDEILPHPFYAEAVRVALPRPPEMHVVGRASHFDFLAPCSAALANVAPAICTRQPGFDRQTFHRDFNASVVRFFEQSLPALR